MMNKITLVLESKLGSDSFDWVVGVKKYTRQKGLLTKNERIFGHPDLDTEDAADYVEPARVQKSKASKKAKSTQKSAPLLVNESSDEEEEAPDEEEIERAEEAERSISQGEEEVAEVVETSVQEKAEEVVEVSSREESSVGESSTSDEDSSSNEVFPRPSSQPGNKEADTTAASEPLNQLLAKETPTPSVQTDPFTFFIHIHPIWIKSIPKHS